MFVYVCMVVCVCAFMCVCVCVCVDIFIYLQASVTCMCAVLPWVLGASGANACQGSRGPTNAECDKAVDVVLKALGRTPGRGVQRGAGNGM